MARYQGELRRSLSLRRSASLTHSFRTTTGEEGRHQEGEGRQADPRDRLLLQGPRQREEARAQHPRGRTWSWTWSPWRSPWRSPPWCSPRPQGCRSRCQPCRLVGLPLPIKRFPRFEASALSLQHLDQSTLFPPPLPLLPRRRGHPPLPNPDLSPNLPPRSHISLSTPHQKLPDLLLLLSSSLLRSIKPSRPPSFSHSPSQLSANKLGGNHPQSDERDGVDGGKCVVLAR